MKQERELKRQLGIGAATALVVGEVIAVGIFLTPAGIAKSLGSPFWLLIVWLTMGGMALCGALCYGELAARNPQAGGGYVYLREAYGPGIGFLYGWMALLVMDPGLTAALASGLASYAGFIVPLSFVGSKVFAIAVIVVLALVNIRGVKFGAWLLGSLTVLKLGLLFSLPLVAFSFRLGDWGHFQPFMSQRPHSAPLIEALGAGMVGAFFSFGGWWDVTKLAGEVRRPGFTLPRALAYGVTIVTFVYILQSAVFIYLVPMEDVTSGETFAAQAGSALFGHLAGQVFAAMVVVAVLGSLAAVIMSAPRVYFAMARDNLFIHSVAATHRRYGTPARAIAVQAVLALLLVLIGSFNQIVSYFVFTVVVFIALTIVSLFVLRRRHPEKPDYLTPGYPLTPILFLLAVTVLLVLLAGNNPRQAFAGVAIVMLGIPVYFLFFRRVGQQFKTKLGD
ncbi:MAG TPA: amino acid permease [Pyrinomonadaceae bacterium]|nr:amino acid permease [Pyrinomonadaceae bacterium]